MASVTVAAVALSAGLWAETALAHCQVPCGIYDDPARVAQIREDVTTIKKAVRLVNELSNDTDTQSKNQLVRWIVVKEQHADRIMRTVADYFMAQKIKPAAKGKKGYGDYLERLARHHAVMVAAMKCKQSAAMTDVTALSRAVEAIAPTWRK